MSPMLVSNGKEEKITVTSILLSYWRLHAEDLCAKEHVSQSSDSPTNTLETIQIFCRLFHHEI